MKYDDDDLLTDVEVADHLGVSAKTVRRWRDQGLLGCVRPPGKSRYVRTKFRQVQEFIAASTRGPHQRPMNRRSPPPAVVIDDRDDLRRTYEIANEILDD